MKIPKPPNVHQGLLMEPPGPLRIFLALPLTFLGVVACGGRQTPAEASPDGHGQRCVTAEQSWHDRVATEKGAPPFPECAPTLESPCDVGDTERREHCTFTLSVDRTQVARTKQPDLCCFGPDA